MVRKSVAFQKSTRRAVKSTAARFVSIVLISFLGAGVFAGLAAVSPNMRQVGDAYYDRQNVMDVRMLSTYGFTDADVAAIRETEGISGVMASFTVDAAGTVGDKDYTFRINGLPETGDPASPDYINQFNMVEGRWPEERGEAVIIRSSIGLKNITLGSTVALDERSNDALPDTLGRLEYTIVGVAESPYYLSFMQGNTAVGGGMINYVLYVPQENFIVDGYTDLYVTLRGAKEQNAFEGAYSDVVAWSVERLEALADERETLRYDGFWSDLADARQEYADADREADEKLADAKAELENGETELTDAKKKYADGLAEYAAQKADADRQLADARGKLNKGATELADAKKKYADGLAEYAAQKADADRQLADAKAELEDGETELADAKQKYADGLAEYTAQKADADRQLADAKTELDDAAAKIADGESQLADKKREYASAKSDLSSARVQLSSGWAEYNTKAAALEEGKAALAENKGKLDAAQAEYDAGASTAEAATGMAMEEIEAALPAMKTQMDSLSQLAQLKAALDADPSNEQTQMMWQGALAAAGLDEAQAIAQISRLEALRAQYTQLADLVAAKNALDQNWADYDEAATQLTAGEAQLSAARQTLERGDAEVAAGSAQLRAAATKLSAAEDELAQAKSAYQDGLAEYADKKAEAETKLADAQAELAAAAAQISDSETKLSDGWKEYYDKKAEADTKLAEAQAELTDAAGQIADAESELSDGWKEYDDKKAEADTKLADARAELNDAAAKIADGETELSDGRQEYEDKKLEASTELSDARQKIGDAEKKLSDLGTPKWYVLDRDMNESFVTYKGDTERMRDLATVFPAVFYLVAALVCLTTMTRMVDEDRTLIGTFKALGYSNVKIAGRYLSYAASASLLGSLGGIAFGFWLIPTIAWNAYGIIFALPEMTPAFYTGIGILSACMTVLVTTLFTGVAVRNSLRESPADLMRPKAPKSGKRVFLEHVKPAWSRLTFTQKVTVRNLGLNKKRLLMSIVGILGCTALVVTALGAKNAVRAIMDDQFGTIFHYQATIGFNGEEPSPELTGLLADGAYFEKSDQIRHGSAEAALDEEGGDAYNVYVVSPRDAERLTDYITLYDPTAKTEFGFTGDSAVITEKLALNLNVGAGDTIWVKYLDGDERHPVKVTAVTRNYAFNYVYLGERAYEAAFGEAPAYNQFLAVTAPGHTDDAVKEYLAQAPDLGAVSFTDDLMGNIRTSISSVNTIIWILIIAAGMLAFVVLYNLTNINVGERQRELATLKVLGFYNRETYGYIFRETAILSTVGCLAGLLAGVFLYRAVVTTVEPDMILLTRDLSWQGYLGAAALTALFTWIVNQCMKPRIKSIDMLESLKSVD